MIDKTKWPFTEEDLTLRDLGFNVFWSKCVDDQDNWIGILEWHECVAAQNNTDSGVSAGGVYFSNAPDHIKGPRWRKLSDAPLTIDPSILCRACGLHGFIREGRWVPA